MAKFKIQKAQLFSRVGPRNSEFSDLVYFARKWASRIGQLQIKVSHCHNSKEKEKKRKGEKEKERKAYKYIYIGAL